MDFFEKGPVSLRLEGLKLLDIRVSSNYDKIQFFQHDSLGRILILDDEIQHIEAWAPLYHETIVHLPAAFVPKIEKVLILGGGCFFTAQEVLKYPTVKQVVMIDIDAEVVGLMTSHYTHAKTVQNDNRFELIIGDAFEEINQLSGNYDLVINDSIDLLLSPFKTKTFKTLLNLTGHHGVCVDMIYRHIFEGAAMLKTIDALKKENISAAYSLLTAPEYPGVLHLVAVWSRLKDDMQNLRITKNEIQQEWLQTPQLNPCEIFNPQCLSYYLYMPPYLKKMIDGSNNL